MSDLKRHIAAVNERFKVDALVTGVDRSYQRSIYRFRGFNQSPYGLECAGALPDRLRAFKSTGSGVTEISLNLPVRDYDNDVPVRGAVAVYLSFVAFNGYVFDEPIDPRANRYVDVVAFPKFFRLATDDEVALAKTKTSTFSGEGGYCLAHLEEP